MQQGCAEVVWMAGQEKGVWGRTNNCNCKCHESCFKLLKEKRRIVTFIAGDMNANFKSKTESIQIHDFYLPDPS